MSIETKKITEDIDLGWLIFVAIIMIVIIFITIKSFIGIVPAYVITALFGLGSIFLYATNQKIREHINNWIMKK